MRNESIKKKGKKNGATKNEKRKESFHCQITFSLPSKTEKKQTKKEKEKDKIDAKNEKRKKTFLLSKIIFKNFNRNSPIKLKQTYPAYPHPTVTFVMIHSLGRKK